MNLEVTENLLGQKMMRRYAARGSRRRSRTRRRFAPGTPTCRTISTISAIWSSGGAGWRATISRSPTSPPRRICRASTISATCRGTRTSRPRNGTRASSRARASARSWPTTSPASRAAALRRPRFLRTAFPADPLPLAEAAGHRGGGKFPGPGKFFRSGAGFRRFYPFWTETWQVSGRFPGAANREEGGPRTANYCGHAGSRRSRTENCGNASPDLVVCQPWRSRSCDCGNFSGVLPRRATANEQNHSYPRLSHPPCLRPGGGCAEGHRFQLRNLAGYKVEGPAKSIVSAPRGSRGFALFCPSRARGTASIDFRCSVSRRDREWSRKLGNFGDCRRSCFPAAGLGNLPYGADG